MCQRGRTRSVGHAASQGRGSYRLEDISWKRQDDGIDRLKEREVQTETCRFPILLGRGRVVFSQTNVAAVLGVLKGRRIAYGPFEAPRIRYHLELKVCREEEKLQYRHELEVCREEVKIRNHHELKVCREEVRRGER